MKSEMDLVLNWISLFHKISSGGLKDEPGYTLADMVLLGQVHA
jgi:hypothetical protein